MNISGINNSNLSWGTLSKKSEQANQESNSDNKSLILNNQNKSNSYSALEKTKENLMKMKEALDEKSMTPEEKKAKLDDINKQIQEVEKQIQQAKMLEKEKEKEELKKKTEEQSTKKPKSGDEVRDGVIISESLKKIIESRNSMKNISDLKITKSTMEVEKGWLSKSNNPDPNAYVNKQYSKLSKGINGLEQRIASESAKIYENSMENTSNKSVENNKEENKSENNEEVKGNEETKEITK